MVPGVRAGCIRGKGEQEQDDADLGAGVGVVEDEVAPALAVGDDAEVRSRLVSNSNRTPIPGNSVRSTSTTP
jgi:hypothetical protein